MGLFDLLRRHFARGTSLAERGERAAAQYLKRSGYRIVAQRSRSRLGEIDLVAIDGRTVVLVEVKTRASADEDSPAEAVDFQKQRRLTRAGLGWLKSHGLLEYRARFDVVAITWSASTKKPSIRHFENAFEPTDEQPMF